MCPGSLEPRHWQCDGAKKKLVDISKYLCHFPDLGDKVYMLEEKDLLNHLMMLTKEEVRGGIAILALAKKVLLYRAVMFHWPPSGSRAVARRSSVFGPILSTSIIEWYCHGLVAAVTRFVCVVHVYYTVVVPSSRARHLCFNPKYKLDAGGSTIP